MSDSVSHGSGAGASQPSAACPLPNVTDELCGVSVVSAERTASSATCELHVGGSRNERSNDVNGRNTLPARVTGGHPSAPVTDSVGLHVRFRS